MIFFYSIRSASKACHFFLIDATHVVIKDKTKKGWGANYFTKG
jgi:hypothetical protein